jgi:hypothetical protein
LDTDGDGSPDIPWQRLLLTIDCTSKPGGRCNALRGAVLVDVLWMFQQVNVTQLDDEAPWKMQRTNTDGTTTTWNAMDADDITDPNDGQQRWDSFANAFHLLDSDGNPYHGKTLRSTMHPTVCRRTPSVGPEVSIAVSVRTRRCLCFSGLQR